MPLDPSIPLSVKPIQLPDPLEVFSAIEQVKGQREAAELRRLAAEEARQRGIEAKAERAEKKQLSELYADAVTVDPVNGQIRYDRDKLLAKAPRHLVPTLLDQLQKDEVSMNTLIKSGFDLDNARRLWLGGEAPDVIDAQGNPEVWKTTLLRARQTGAMDQSTYEQLQSITDPQDILARAQAWVTRAAGKPGELEKISTVDAQGRPVTQFVKPTAGASYPAAPEKAPNIGSFEDYVVRRYGPTPTAAQIALAHREWQPPAPPPLQLIPIIGPDGKPTLVPEGQAIGATPASAIGETGGLKLTGTQQEDIATMLTVQDLSKLVLERGEALQWSGVGPVAGRAGSLLAGVGVGDPKAEELRNFIGNIQGTIAKLRGGTAFSAQEQKMLESYTPTPQDSPLKIKAKLRSLDQFITAKRENMLRVAGGEYTPRNTSAVTTVAKEGDVKPIPGHPGTEQTYRNGKWIRTK